MGELIFKTGDVFTSDAGAIAHGVNTQGVMGAGIAKQFRERYPDMYSQYRRECQFGRLQPGGMMAYLPGHGEFGAVYNIASQRETGPNAKIEWLGAGVYYALKDAESRGFGKIAMPRIGTGIGGLDWEEVEPWLRGLARASNVDIEVWTL